MLKLIMIHKYLVTMKLSIHKFIENSKRISIKVMAMSNKNVILSVHQRKTFKDDNNQFVSYLRQSHEYKTSKRRKCKLMELQNNF